jgi:hypothetical protein
MTLNMSEMNGNEKYYNLPENFRADSPFPARRLRRGRFGQAILCAGLQIALCFLTRLFHPATVTSGLAA